MNAFPLMSRHLLLLLSEQQSSFEFDGVILSNLILVNVSNFLFTFIRGFSPLLYLPT